tara:strand:+ start:720 stop:926 length:207 start_codon:yes stop_codon:yes gene_type:complete
MERYISEADIMVAIKKHRDTLSYDDKFDFEMETSILNLTKKSRNKINSKSSALEFRLKKYGIHKDKNK